MTTRKVSVMEVGLSSAAAAAPPRPSASAIAGAAMNHLIPRSILDWRPASSASLPAHTLRISAEDLADLSSKGATDDSNFKRPTAVYVSVPIVTICLGIASLYCYLQWKKSLVQKRERKLEKVAQRRRRVSMKQGAAAASTGSGVSAEASSLITPLTVASAPPAVLGLVTKVEIVDKMILEFESRQCGASMPQQHLINVDDKTFNVTINPLYNSLQSGACGYVRSGAEIKNKALAIAEEIHRRSTLLINFQNTPSDNYPAKAGVRSKYRNDDADNAKDISRSLPQPKTQRESLPRSKTKGQSMPTSSERGAIKSTALRPLSRLSQVSSSSTPASPRSPTASAAEHDSGLARSSSFSTSASDDELSASSTSRDVGSMFKSSSAGDLDNATISKFMEGLASSPSSPRRVASVGPSGEYNPSGGSSGAGPSRTRKSLSFVIDSSPEDFEPDLEVSSSPPPTSPPHDPSSSRQPPAPSSLTSNLHDPQRPVPERS